MTQATLNAQIRVNGQDEPLTATTLAALLDEKAVDTGAEGHRGRAQRRGGPARGVADDAAEAGRQRRDRTGPSGRLSVWNWELF